MKRGLGVVVALATLVVVALVGLRLADGWTRPVPRLAEVHGEVALTDASGAELAAELGRALRVDERVRTGEGGQAVLEVGAGTQITVEAGTEVRIADVDGETVGLELADGRLRADVRAGGTPVRIGHRGRTITVEDATATATVRDGDLVASVDRGQVGVEGVAGVESVPAGQRLIALDGEPAAVLPVPDALVLSVAWPPALTRREREVVEGEADPGAAIEVVGGVEPVRTRASTDGRFRVEVVLPEGITELEVRVRPLDGPPSTRTHTVERDAAPPTIRAVIEP